MSDFDAVAAWYDLLAGGPARVERESNLLLLALGPGQRVLDLACGTGLHARFFADHGASVTAVDLSEAMLRVARAIRDHPAIRWVQGSMLDTPSGPWDLVTCLGNSIALLASPDDVTRFFQRAADVLAPGGALLAQLLNGAGTAWRLDRDREVHATLNGMPVTIRKRWQFQKATDISLNVLLTVERWDPPRDTPAERVETLLRLWYPEFLEAQARATGLLPESRWGGMVLEPYIPEDSPDYVCLGRKPALE
ncbi:MAG TPA: class I SAM-dependent methyltransferase [Candidatus Hydrogenedentes bacterium]|nr:class I SAM-dependent methyltransferase [Candidatus Hydrogenedentota bacterium]HOK89332.1 class I SAM-dependent methyltransferase [Candidatus Hydrogenedentota bacterium]HOV60982.1 class I SAM-dependent methyltransferase [Candidatus Hydrogenedentota bacterium]